MSRAAIKTDVERTAIMLDLLHRRYITEHSHVRPEPGPRWIMMEEVAPGTGGFSRLADVLVLDCWRSGGLSLSGWEIKASRADLKRELADPGKSSALSRYCDNWSILVWGKFVYEGLTIPETWGIFDVNETDGIYELVKIRAPKPIKPEPWPKTFVASMVRNAFCQSPGSIYLGRATATSYREGVENGRAIESTRVWQLIEPLRKHLYGDDAWRHRDDDLEELVANAIKAVPTREKRAAAAVDGITGPVIKMP